MKTEEKLKIYRILGAEKFQKVVFLVEDIKYKIIDRFSPNITDWYNKKIEEKYHKDLKFLENNKRNREVFRKYKIDKNFPWLVSCYEKIVDKFFGSMIKLKEYEDITGDNLFSRVYQLEKMTFKKEIVQRKNRNYHYNKNYPTQIIYYLKKNKEIHQRGILRNIFVLSLVGGYCLLPLPKFPVFIGIVSVFEVGSLLMNFQCINLQNYNLCRFEEEKTKQKLVDLESRTIKRNIEKVSECIEPVSHVVRDKVGDISIDDIVDSIKTKEQSLELLGYLKSQLTSLQKSNQTDEDKQKKIGGL